jgi:O-acetyl-ADP-ribose deacetylase (regulator of RNase III)
VEHFSAESPQISYVLGDATRPAGAGFKVIAHICNDEGRWGKGFVLSLSRRWKQPELQYRAWSAQTPPPALGDVQFVEVERDIAIANIIGQHGIENGPTGQPPIRYEALEQGLQKISAFALKNGATVHMPRIGCGLAGGTWENIEPIIARTLAAAGVAVTVYDFVSA